MEEKNQNRNQNPEQQQTPHKRRVRYKGTHPRRFEEKYKELNPEKYADTIEHVIQKGGHRPGMHISIMVKEILVFYRSGRDKKAWMQLWVMAGHIACHVRAAAGRGHIYGLDVDPIESVKTKKRLEDLGFGEDIMTVRQMNFADIDQIAEEAGPFDFILADLGVSSMQIDNPERGFSYKFDGPLDLRLNPQAGISAAERLKEVDREELAGMLVENSDEPYAEEIARCITGAVRRGEKVDTTTKVRELIEEALSFIPEKERKEAVKKACARTFQALRIDVNSEFEVLYAFLDKLPHVLAPGGRVAVLTFHSGEDRMVKKSFKQYRKAGLYSEISEDVIRPSAEECVRNSRARSTKLRWAVRAE